MAINNDEQPARTAPSTASNPLVNAKLTKENSFYALNVSPASRGTILTIEKPDAESANMVFAPMHATPVMMKVSKAEVSDEKFSAFFGALGNNTPISIGGTLSYWDGAGRCIDFSGSYIWEAFNERPDRAAIKADDVPFWETSHGLDWEKINEDGNVYLKTIFYTPPGQDIVIAARKPSGNVSFFTPDALGANVPVNGISGMKYNNYAAGEIGMISTIQDVLDMVSKQQICVTNTGTKTKFWWNPQTIYTQEGRQRSIDGLERSLEAGKSCIGRAT